MVVEAFISEYERYKSLTELAVEQVSQEDFISLFGDDGNSIAIILKHLAGNLKSRFTNFLVEDGEKPWRDRDSEFEEEKKLKSELIADLNNAFQIVFNELNKLSDDKLNRTVVIRGNELTVAEALSRSLAHTSYHVGQIVLMAKLYAGNNWKSLSIPKGKSREYNFNPSKEK
jgi:uncharacterized damage-inducible protein DinB